MPFVHWPIWKEELFWHIAGCQNSTHPGQTFYAPGACADDFEHLNLERLSLKLLIIAACFAVLYLLFEGGPCHWTRLAEAWYLIFVLSTTAVAFLVVPNKNLDGRTHVAFYVARFMAVLIVMKIYVSVINPRHMKPFYAHGDNRTFTRTRPHSDDKLAQRVLQQLEVYMTKLSIKREVGLFHRQVFSILLLPLLYTQMAAMNYFEVAWVLFHPIRVAWVLLMTYLVIQEVPRIVIRRNTLNKVKELLTYVLEQCDHSEMREIYMRVNLESIFQATRYEVHELLVESALGKGLLDVWSKAMLLNGMQKYGVNGRRNEYVRDLILSCKNTELTELKSILDSTGDYNCLFKLIYNDLRSTAIRDEVLYHIAKEAAAARSVQRGAVGLKVVSDIDDTLLCSGAAFPAGCDDRIPRHMIYPGALQLFKELDRSWTPEDPCCNLAFLSARPHIYKDVSESKSFAKFLDLFSTGRLYCVPTLLPGSLSLGLWAVVKALFIAAHGWREVGERKAKMFEQYKALYGEYDFIFFGDNGQGDLLAGQLLVAEDLRAREIADQDEESSDNSVSTSSWCPCRRKSLTPTWRWRPGQGPQLKAVMIHEVQPDMDSLGLERPEHRPPNWRQQLEEQGICIFSSYPAAALKLHYKDAELISIRQLRVITEAAIMDFDSDRKFMAEWEDWSLMNAILSQDIQRVGVLLDFQNDPLQIHFKDTSELFKQDEVNILRQKHILQGIYRRANAHLFTCGEQELSDGPDNSEDSEAEASDSRSEPVEMSVGHVRSRRWDRAVTTIGGWDLQPPKAALLKHIGSAWKELQAMNHNDAL